MRAHETDEGLAVADRPIHRPLERFRERHPMNLDHLRALERGHRRRDTRGEIEVQDFREDPG